MKVLTFRGIMLLMIQIRAKKALILTLSQVNGVNDAAADSDDDDGEDDDEEKEEEDENGLALTPVSWQCAMMKAEYHWVVPCTLSVVHHCLCTMSSSSVHSSQSSSCCDDHLDSVDGYTLPNKKGRRVE